MLKFITQVHRFPNLAAQYKKSKFQPNIHSKRKMWMLNLEQTDAEDCQIYCRPILFTINNLTDFTVLTCFELKL